MKRLLLILALLLPLAVAAQSPLYQRYAQRTDLAVAEVSGMRLNDTVKVDVVLLVANDAQAWQQIKQELDIRTSSGVTSWLAAPTNPARRAQWNGSPVCKAIASHARRTVALYLITSEQQYDALLDYQMTHTKNKDL